MGEKLVYEGIPFSEEDAEYEGDWIILETEDGKMFLPCGDPLEIVGKRIRVTVEIVKTV